MKKQYNDIKQDKEQLEKKLNESEKFNQTLKTKLEFYNKNNGLRSPTRKQSPKRKNYQYIHGNDSLNRIDDLIEENAKLKEMNASKTKQFEKELSEKNNQVQVLSKEVEKCKDKIQKIATSYDNAFQERKNAFKKILRTNNAYMREMLKRNEMLVKENSLEKRKTKKLHVNWQVTNQKLQEQKLLCQNCVKCKEAANIDSILRLGPKSV